MQDIRWKQRYDNFNRIVSLLNDNLEGRTIESFSELERGGLGQWFELSFELLWKLLKDYMEYEEVDLGLLSPKNIIRTAAEVGLLEKMDIDGDILLKMHRSRNELAHIYDNKKAMEIFKQLQEHYLSEMLKLDTYFKELITNE